MASSNDFCLSSLLEANLDDNDELELAEYVLWVYMLGLPEDSSRAPLILKTEFDYLRCICEDESGNDCCLSFIMLSRVMQDQPFLEQICQRSQQRIVEIEELYGTQNSPSPSSTGMETAEINADPPTPAPQRTQAALPPALMLNPPPTVSSSISSPMLVSPAVFASLVVLGCLLFIFCLTYCIYYQVQKYDRKQSKKLEEEKDLEKEGAGNQLCRTKSCLARLKEADEYAKKNLAWEHLEAVIFRQNALRDTYELAGGQSMSESGDGMSSSTGDGVSYSSCGGSTCSGENIQSSSPFSNIVEMKSGIKWHPDMHKISASSNKQNIEVGAGPDFLAESDELVEAVAPQAMFGTKAA